MWFDVLYRMANGVRKDFNYYLYSINIIEFLNHMADIKDRHKHGTTEHK